jgi:uncharacterized protein (TIGR03437 family)
LSKLEFWSWRNRKIEEEGMRKLNNHTGRILCLILVLGGLMSGAALILGAAVVASAQVIGPSWSSTGNLNQPRFNYTATLLTNGKVLIAGGSDGAAILNGAELYDPATGTWSATGNLNTPRSGNTATLLANGKVLVAGGLDRTRPPFSSINIAELYDPATGTWSNTGNLNTERASHTATLLPNGKVLVAGGFTNNFEIDLSSAELYDPATGTWSSTGNLNTPRYGQTAILLPSGKVLVAGGFSKGNPSFLNSAELYDPVIVHTHAVTHWPGGAFLNSAELYDPVTGTWSSTGNLNSSFADTATLLPNGKVLVVVGDHAELYDLATGTWSVTSNLNTPRVGQTATLLPSGKVLVAGGFSYDILQGDISAELYDPATGMWSVTVNLNTPRYGHTATPLPNGKVLVAGGDDGSHSILNSAELFDLGPPQPGTVASVSAASYSSMGLASESIAASFGADLATTTVRADTLPLPMQLGATTVKVTDSVGNERPAPLFFVSPTQVNYQIPPGTAAGVASVTITREDGSIATGVALIKAVGPSLFTANGDGQGVAAALVLRVKADGSQSYEEIAQFDAAQNKFLARPLDLGPEGDQVFLLLFGTGFRFHSSLSTVIATIGGAYAEVSFAGEQPDYVGLDQVNMLLPRSMIGRGEVDVLLTVEAQMANAVRINIK